jgi:hypothetical protein
VAKNTGRKEKLAKENLLLAAIVLMKNQTTIVSKNRYFALAPAATSPGGSDIL